MSHTQIHEDNAESYSCPTVNRKCLGALCMAWVGGRYFKVTHKKGLTPSRFVPENWLQRTVGGNPEDWTWEPVRLGRCGMVPR